MNWKSANRFQACTEAMQYIEHGKEARYMELSRQLLRCILFNKPMSEVAKVAEEMVQLSGGKIE